MTSANYSFESERGSQSQGTKGFATKRGQVLFRQQWVSATSIPWNGGIVVRGETNSARNRSSSIGDIEVSGRGLCFVSDARDRKNASVLDS